MQSISLSEIKGKNKQLFKDANTGWSLILKMQQLETTMVAFCWGQTDWEQIVGSVVWVFGVKLYLRTTKSEKVCVLCDVIRQQLNEASQKKRHKLLNH